MAKHVPNQRSPSRWMLVAILQSLAWFFGIPILCRKYVWDNIFGNIIESHPEYGVEISKGLISCTVGPSIFACYTLVMIPVYAGGYPFFERYKIHAPTRTGRKTCWPWFDPRPDVRQKFWNLSYRSLYLIAFNYFVLLPSMGALQLYITRNMLGRKSHPNLFSTDDEHWPSVGENARDILLMTVIHEFGFYFTHKWMHEYPFLYKYHKVHHEYKINTTLASMHNHPIDFIFSLGTPGFLAVSLVPWAHSISLFLWVIWLFYANVDDHVGYAFPWSPVRWFPFSASTDEHEFHHSVNKGCFGSKISIFGWMFGGYEDYYDRVCDSNRKKEI
mmetsp:Transcript_7702/g.19183  ORF Transcript_7702/g.19183 Transcript_7702/m.19183 type:complete len:330 (-) Transcript_7702:600-1589(-)|eukprot:CAMPEP_0172391180 /NCGR_PEP_ID=MMETSP1061-20121228/7640_1 /TAXON_ID=37318 /ORGANISM="Pseudo-nitzschia pungens, Strain cf. pungens" /LENGTH=329 /DNA_ID=CAMNT_0013121727 /DNA_START=261 /DNA_END=1250 /DNA_ORIENTATION=+